MQSYTMEYYIDIKKEIEELLGTDRNNLQIVLLNEQSKIQNNISFKYSTSV